MQARVSRADETRCVLAAPVDVIAPHYPEGTHGRLPFSLKTMLRIHFIQQWFTLSDHDMEEAFFLYRKFAQLEEHTRLPDESTILRFRHRLEKHQLAGRILSTISETPNNKAKRLTQSFQERCKDNSCFALPS